MAISNISTVSQLKMMYSNNSGALIMFDLLQALIPTDSRVLEVVAVNEDLHVYNMINNKVPLSLMATFNEITEEARSILSTAFETQDDSGIVTVYMPKSNVIRVWRLAVPNKNEIYNQEFPNSIIQKEVNVTFSCAKPQDKATSG